MTILEGEAWRREYDAKVVTMGAWKAAAFMRAKKLPPLKKVLAGKRKAAPAGPQSIEEQAAILRMLQAGLGGRLTEKGRA